MTIPLATASNLNTLSSAFGQTSVQPTSTITQTSNWFGDTFIQPWADFGGQLAQAGKGIIEDVAANLPSYFAQKWGIIPQAGTGGDVRYPAPQAPEITIPMPDWAKNLLDKPGAAYEEARSSLPNLNLGILAIGLILVVFVLKRK